MVHKTPESGNKLDTRWIRPGVVVAKEGESSYQIEIKPGHTIGAHGGALKFYTPDKHTESFIKMFYHRRTPTDPEGAPDEFILEKILGHEEVGVEYFFV